jgi:phosphoadenosine phosphosulfate reductase
LRDHVRRDCEAWYRGARAVRGERVTLVDLRHGSAEEVLSWTYKRFSRVALVASFQAESMVLIDMACEIVPSPEVLTLDTGRLHEETHDFIEQVRRRYPIRLRILAPDSGELEAMTAEHGTTQFLRSVALRNECCAVRKVNPLARALEDYDAWITGLRREQTPTRAATPVVAGDPGHGDITKVVPLAGWSRAEVWDYLTARGIEHHPLYDRGYTSIGCAPCTRATEPGENERAGRWWWEGDSAKECLLHPPLESGAQMTLRGSPVSVPLGGARSTSRP